MNTRRLLAGAVTASILVAVAADSSQAMVIVEDPASIAQEIKEVYQTLQSYVLQTQQWATQNLQWAKQVQQYAVELEHYEQDVQLFLNFYHYPNIGTAMGLMSTAGLGTSLPVTGYAMMGLVNGFQSGNFGIPQISGIIGSLANLTSGAWSANHIFTPTDGSWESQQLISRANGIAGQQGAAQAAYTDLQTHANVLNGIRSNLNEAVDTKSVLDATAQTQVETAWTINEMAKMQSVTATYEAQRDAIAQRGDEKLSMDIEQFIASAPAQ